ncbi:hypothetical protein G9G39_06810 [Cronobacter sp. EKM101R]|uniref:hypothetical protein n=1 Tax=Cronobacter TaxID=413496 RepID=UPI0013EA6781|nr:MULTISPECIES: hypothetical protein [Cronobacter]KAF6596769.1 hypothetical protein G9G39_06810 [Cronobacter sp. EKM101R]KAF6599595.1 hypothetical protein G9G38_06445 [Cronobacter sp. EKM102R]MDK1185163.1 hypothetical protein [Cronobacter turicensis]MDK1195294.1 hypothetical protein [Cronobacter dublinensis]MDK1200437.1 hypothetical protein [Cronobacter dublinensis]
MSNIIDVNTAEIFNAIGGGSPLSIIDSVLHPQYVIRDSKTHEIALEFSGMASIQPNGRAQITTAPVEEGQYQAINKVREPARVRCTILINGLTGFSGNIPNIFDLTFTSQSAALDTIKTMLASANTYDIETPKETLRSFDLVDHYYEVNSQKGVTLLTVYLDFQEVIQQMEVTLSGAQSREKPTDDAKSNGQTGLGAPATKGGGTPSTVDELSKSWDSLKSALGDVAGNVGKTIKTSFQSALDTVSKPARDIADSAAQKAADMAKNISRNTT